MKTKTKKIPAATAKVFVKAPSTSHPATIVPKDAEEPYEEGDKVEVQRSRMGQDSWLRGTITYTRSDGTHDIRYDNGEAEDSVKSSSLRPWIPAKESLAASKRAAQVDPATAASIRSKIWEIKRKPGLRYALDVLESKTSEGGSSPQQLFEAIDKDGSGDITNAEMVDGLKKWGIQLPIIQMRTLFEAFDADGNGTIDMLEFTGLMSLYKEERRREEREAEEREREAAKSKATVRARTSLPGEVDPDSPTVWKSEGSENALKRKTSGRRPSTNSSPAIAKTTSDPKLAQASGTTMPGSKRWGWLRRLFGGS